MLEGTWQQRCILKEGHYELRLSGEAIRNRLGVIVGSSGPFLLRSGISSMGMKGKKALSALAMHERGIHEHVGDVRSHEG